MQMPGPSGGPETVDQISSTDVECACASASDRVSDCPSDAGIDSVDPDDAQHIGRGLAGPVGSARQHQDRVAVADLP